MSTNANTASTMGVARMPTQGSCRPSVCIITGLPSRSIERRSMRMLDVGLMAASQKNPDADEARGHPYGQ